MQNEDSVIRILQDIDPAIIDRNTPERASQCLICRDTLLRHFQDRKIHKYFKKKSKLITLREFCQFLEGLEDNANTGKFHEYVSSIMAYYSTNCLLNGLPSKAIGHAKLRLETRVVWWLKRRIVIDERLHHVIKVTTQEQVVERDKRYFDIRVENIFIEVHENKKNHDDNENDRLKRGLVGVRQGIICYFKESGLKEDPVYPEKWYQDTLFPLLHRSLLSNSGTSLKKDVDGKYIIVDDPERQRRGEWYRHKLVCQCFADAAKSRARILENKLNVCVNQEETIKLEAGIEFWETLIDNKSTSDLLTTLLKWKEKEIRESENDKAIAIIPLQEFMESFMNIQTNLDVLDKIFMLTNGVDYIKTQDDTILITWKCAFKLTSQLDCVPQVQRDTALEYLLSVQDTYEKIIIPEISRNFSNIMRNVLTHADLVETHIYKKATEEATRKANTIIMRLQKQIAELNSVKFLNEANMDIQDLKEKYEITVLVPGTKWGIGKPLWDSDRCNCPFETGTIADQFSRFEFESICKKLGISSPDIKQMVNIYTSDEPSSNIMRYLKRLTIVKIESPSVASDGDSDDDIFATVT